MGTLEGRLNASLPNLPEEVMTSNTIALSGYQIAEQIYEGSRTLVYRGMRETDSQTAIVKVLRNPHPHFRELVQFRNQYIITRHLDSPYIVRPLALERYGNGYALVMPDEGAIALGDYWQQSDRNLSLFLNVALQLAEALHYLGQQRIIHKDIKPANILLCHETQQVKLIDFSISSLLPKETQQLINPNILEGTLAYISPEQTGRMNRGIDYRTDFYSLGVTFYELLTGELPFQVDDPMELVHCHIAKSPPTLRRREDIPKVLSNIVMKLMAKNAEDRYQGALGLKHDLEKCQHQWEMLGAIEMFLLGERDLCDRFLIPEKLYGREHDITQLLAAFERVAEGTSEMMMVAGFSGIGKTAVVNEVHKPIVKNCGYFIKGKFDQFNRNIPFSAFVQAFRNLMGQILSESDPKLADWKTKILEAVGNNGQVLIDVIPELETVIGKQPNAPALSGSAAQNRFNLLFEKFIAVFTTKEHPLAIFLDDLQWADSASLNLMKVLMGDNQTGYLLVLGAYRDNEVFPAHPLMLTLAELAQQEAEVSTITLSPLSVHHINQLIAETLSCQAEQSQPLTELVYQKTQGNPFFTTQFLKGLYEDGLISFNPNLGYWECDLVKVQDASLTDDVVEFMAGRLQKLSEATQKVLKLAACIGNQFELETLAIVCEEEREEIASNIWGALQEGLILPISEAYKFFQGNIEEVRNQTVPVGYRFLHDRVQQAAYSLIPEEQKQTTHLKIGQLLLGSTPEHQLKTRIFDIVNQLNAGRGLISDPTERENLATLNLTAGQKALSKVAYQGAFNYFQVGIHCLQNNCWQTQYTLTLSLYELAAESAYLITDFAKMKEFVDIVRKKAKKLLDTIKVCEVMILGLTAQSQPQQAIKTALPVLQALGTKLPETPKMQQVLLGYLAAKLSLMGKKPSDITKFSRMENLASQAVMRILVKLTSAAVFCQPKLVPLIGFKLVELSAKYGNASESSYGYAMYGGFILCGLLNQQELGYQFAQSALKLWSEGNSQYLTTKVLFMVNCGSTHWKNHFNQTLEPLKEAYLSGLETGDIEYMGYAACIYCLYAYLTGAELNALKQEMQKYGEAVKKNKQELPFYQVQISYQAVLNLLGNSDRPWHLSGEAYNQVEMAAIHQQANDCTTLQFAYFHATLLGYLFEQYDLAKEGILGFLDNADPSTAFMAKTPVFHFYESLIYVAVYPMVSRSEKKRLLAKVTRNQKKITKWARFAPMNYQHKYDLVEAERHRVLGRQTDVIEMYDRAIAGAKANEYIQEEALANELAAKFYLEWGKEKIAATYMQEAYYGYARWGAKAKTDHLEQTYPQLLTPILQQQRVEFNPITSLESLTQTLSATQQSYTSSSTNLSEALDFASVLQAGQALSHTIELDPLLDNIVRIILTNAGAQKVALLIPQEEQWQLRAIAQLNREGSIETSTELQPLTAESPLPIRLVRYVKNTQQPVLINEAKTEISGILKGYLFKHQPQSVFCAPLLNQNKLVAILYLEHPTTQGVFTSNRQTIVQFLCSQAAIALENAQLYQTSQDYAEKLSQSLQDLQDAQLQLVQQEKMATLGNLIAGVAHELNNPIGFIAGSISLATSNLQELSELLSLYQEYYPNPAPEIVEAIEEIEPDYLLEELPELFSSMQQGADRIIQISRSMRIFSRKDTEQKVEANLHDGIDSTLLILKHRLKANEKHPAIQVLKNYEEIPTLQCFPGQLNQVFMNILANAIDAFEEANQGQTYAEIKANPNSIEIRTSMAENGIRIQIQDNGGGMKPEVRERIFEQGFTTKGVGKGTGLGMAIARQIVEEKHGGRLSCQSELGKGTEFTIRLPLT